MSEVSRIEHDGLLPPSPINGQQLEAGKGGRAKNAGNSIKEWVNTFANNALRGELVEDQMRKWAKDPRQPWPKRMALNRILTALERPDIADFEPALDGQMSLRELRAAGIDTAMVKKVKAKQRTIPGHDGGDSINEVEREIELHDRAAGAWRDIIDDTDGKPSQHVRVDGAVELRAVVFQFTDTDGSLHGGSIADIRAGLPGAAQVAGTVGDGGGAAGNGQDGSNPDDAGGTG